MSQVRSVYSRLARQAIQHYILTGEHIKQKDFEGYDDALAENKACFVSLHLADGSLRGCIGTIEPAYSCLFEEIVRNAISSATRDHRFDAVSQYELPQLELSVDILTPLEEVPDTSFLDPSIYGVVVRTRKGSRAVLLPGIPGIVSVEEQMRIVKRKAGIQNTPDHELILQRFSSTRYH